MILYNGYSRGAAPHGRAALVAAVIALTFTSLAADPAITVSARQRYPWNGLRVACWISMI